MGLLSGGFATGFIEGFADSVSDAIEKDMDRVNKRVERISELKLKRAIKDQEERDEKIKEVTEALAEAQSLFGKDDPRAPAYAAAMLKESGSISSFKELTNTIKSSDTYKRGESISNFLEFSEKEMPTGTISDFAKSYVGKPKSISDYRLPEDSVTAGAGNLLSAIGIKQDVSGRIESRVGEELAAMGLSPAQDTEISVNLPSGVFQREKFTLSNMTPTERLKYYNEQLAYTNNTQERIEELQEGLRTNNAAIIATGKDEDKITVLKSRLSRASGEEADNIISQIADLNRKVALDSARTSKNPLDILDAELNISLAKAIETDNYTEYNKLKKKRDNIGKPRDPMQEVKDARRELALKVTDGDLDINSNEFKTADAAIRQDELLIERIYSKGGKLDISKARGWGKLMSEAIEKDIAKSLTPERQKFFNDARSALSKYGGNLELFKKGDPTQYDNYMSILSNNKKIQNTTINRVLSGIPEAEKENRTNALYAAQSIFNYGGAAEAAAAKAVNEVTSGKVTITGDGSEQEPVKTEDVSLNTDFKVAFPDNRPGAIKLINKALEKGTPLSDIALELENNGDYSPEFIKIIKDEAARIEAKPENEIAVTMQQDQNRDIASAMLIVDDFHNTLLAPNFIAQPSKVNRLVREKLNLGDTKEDKEKASRLIELARQRIVERETPDRTKVDRRQSRTGRAVGGLMSRG